MISFKSWNASARVIVYIIYTRPTVQTGVINTVVNVCQKHRSIIYNVSGLLEVQVELFQIGIQWENQIFPSKRHTCLAMTPSIPFKAVTREIIDAIHTRTTVLTSVIYTVINVCKFNKNKGNKGIWKESTIRGHRKNLIPRWDSNPRPSVF